MNEGVGKALQVCAVIFALALSPGHASATEPQSPAASWLNRLKTLEGEWKGKTPSGKDTRLSYKNIAGGTTVMEVFSYGEGPGAMSMYTLYHLDGESLMLTHYCVSNNQPRMRAELPAQEPNVLRFSFVDATNLQNPAAGHMHRALLRIIDDNHIANEWTYRKDNKDAFSEGAQYERVK